MPGDLGGGGFLGAIASLAGALVSFIRQFVGITVNALLRFVQLLKDYVVQLAHDVVSGLWRLGKSIARAVRAIGVLAAHGLRSFITWAWDNLKALQAWLRDHLAPVLRFIRRIKDEIELIYKRFVRPILDVIDFIRALDRTLQVFGINVLKALDEKLTRIEQRIEEPFIYLQKKIVWLENWIDRIVTLDGLFQRLTLIASMSRYAAPWMHGFWNGQIDRNLFAGDDYSRTRIYPRDEVWAPGKELALFYSGQRSRIDGDVAELVPMWRQAAGVDPPGPEDG